MYDVAIIGAGPAGASAAIFTAKAGKKTVVFDSDQGVTRRAWVRNHYGVEDIQGSDLVAIGKKQAQSFGADIVMAKVEDVKKQADGFTLHTDAGDYQAKYVIFATGLWADLAEKIGLKTKPATEPRIKTVIEVDPSGRTNIEGIWAAGTVAGVSVHTIITAGDGAKVAVNLLSEMNGERYVDHDILQAK
ncbi:MAG: FAD-dependent oxidoreductase [Alicyclobacillus sp.]|nr:FAD-dependent oxidoreductase [Alicyclobacillus sp.]